MHTHDPTRQRQEGAILAVVLVMMVVLAFLGVGLLTLSNATGYEAGTDVSALQAFWTAEAGLEQVKAIGVKRKKPYSAITQAGSPSGKLWGSNALSGITSKGSYAVDVLDDPAWTNAVKALKKYIIVSRATSGGGKQQRVSQSAMIQSFASYMHASNYEEMPGGGGDIYFLTGDIIDGPVYVNDQINIWGTPVFSQLVSSAASSVNYQNGGNSSVFKGGYTLNAPPLDIAGQFSSDHVQDIKSEASSGGLTLTGTYNFNFKNDGSFTYIPRATGTPTNTGYLSGLNGAIYVNGSVWVEGIVNGSVTLAAQDSIYISNSITYASAQSPTPWDSTFIPGNVTDKLGLIASNRCIVMPSNSVSIHAAIMVTSGNDGFGATNRYRDISAPYLNLYGSLSQYRRGVVSQAGSTFLGFRKRYKFDVRFNTDSPPNFPYSMYTFSRWEQDGY